MHTALLPASDTRRQLERMLLARDFVSRQRIARLLRFFIEESLRNGHEPIDQRSIALQALHLSDEFSPSRSAYVRVNVARLRKTVAAYFAESGRHDPIVFEVTNGPYRLIATRRDGVPDPTPALAAREARRLRPLLLLGEPGMSGGQAGHEAVGRRAALRAANLLLESMLVTVSGPVLHTRPVAHETPLADLATTLGFDYWTDTQIHTADDAWHIRIAIVDTGTGKPVREATGALGAFATSDEAADALAAWMFHSVGDCFATQPRGSEG